LAGSDRGRRRRSIVRSVQLLLGNGLGPPNAQPAPSPRPEDGRLRKAREFGRDG